MSEDDSIVTVSPLLWEPLKVICPVHGEHAHVISSTIAGHEGHWCQLCWLDSLGPALPTKGLQ